MKHHDQFDYRDLLKQIEWEDGKLLEKEVIGSYRHAVTLVCSKLGRTKGEFANGTFPYFAYYELLSPNGEWIKSGNNIVPVLPDGRFLMVVEQQPIFARYPDRPHVVVLDNGHRFDIGLAGSLIFPGGAYNPGESFTSGILRELHEETEVAEQRAQIIRRVPGVYPYSSDLAHQITYSVAYLSGLSFSDYVENDGGLRVVALSETEVLHNIWNGVISSAQAALCGWALYQEIIHAKENGTFDSLVQMGYLAIDDVQIVKSK